MNRARANRIAGLPEPDKLTKDELKKYRKNYDKINWSRNEKAKAPTNHGDVK